MCPTDRKDTESRGETPTSGLRTLERAKWQLSVLHQLASSESTGFGSLGPQASLARSHLPCPSPPQDGGVRGEWCQRWRRALACDRPPLLSPCGVWWEVRHPGQETGLGKAMQITHHLGNAGVLTPSKIRSKYLKGNSNNATLVNYSPGLQRSARRPI